MTRCAALLLLASGCYLSHQTDAGGEDDRPIPDGSVPDADATVRDGEVPACTPRWSSCRVAWTTSWDDSAEGRSPDVAWAFGSVAVVAREGDAVRLARWDEAGTPVDEVALGTLGDPRIASHPELGALVAGNLSLRWVGPDGVPRDAEVPNRPLGADAFGVDVATVPGGYLLFAIPGGPGDPPALFASLSGSASTPDWGPFAEREPLLPYEHAEDPQGFATHLAFEAGPDGIFPLAFELGPTGPGALVGEGDRRGATTFIDGVVALDGRVYVYYQGFFPTLVEIGAPEPTVFQLDPLMGTGNNGHVANVEDRVVLFLTENEGSVLAAPWEPTAGLGTPLTLAEPDGRRTRDVRAAPWPRGLLATWECADGICLGAIECCP